MGLGLGLGASNVLLGSSNVTGQEHMGLIPQRTESSSWAKTCAAVKVVPLEFWGKF